MFLWSTKSLVIDFKNNEVSQRETMKYLLTVSLLGLCGTFIEYLHPSEELTESGRLYLYIEYLLYAAITIIGIYLCYDKNHKLGGENFIERFVCLALPVGIKSFTIIMILMVGMGISRGFMSEGGLDLYLADPSNMIKYGVFYEILFYSGIYKAIININEQPVMAENKILQGN